MRDRKTKRVRKNKMARASECVREIEKKKAPARTRQREKEREKDRDSKQRLAHTTT